MRDVEAVEKVPSLLLRHDGAKIDLPECPVFDNRNLGNGKRTSENDAILQLGTFSTASLGFPCRSATQRGFAGQR